MQRHDEEKQIVVLTAEDIKNVKDFFEHFKIEMPQGISSCIERFSKDPKAITFQDQRTFRALIAHAMVTVDQPLIKDKAFANIR